MPETSPQPFVKALLTLLDETFDHVQGYYLDKNSSLFDTLSTLTAVEASIAVGGKCATLAAQVKHTAFYLQVLQDALLDPNSPPADWGEVWRTTSAVNPSEWQAIQTDLRSRYTSIQAFLATEPDLGSEDTLGMLMAVLAHTAYHLGEIRQALCVIKA